MNRTSLLPIMGLRSIASSKKSPTLRSQIPKSPDLMALFNQVPCDVQLDILQGWIGNPDSDRELLLTLSAMDVACCNRSLRRRFLELPARLAFQKAGCCENKTCLMILDMLCYMKWLRDRRIAVKCLHSRNKLVDLPKVRDQLKFTLPCEILTLGHKTIPYWLEGILRACPDVHTVRWDGDEGVWIVRFWELLATVPLPKLSTLNLMAIRWHVASKYLKGLRAIGHQLQHLRMPCTLLSDEVLEVMVNHCQQLRTLDISMAGVPVWNILQLLRSCQQLQELTLRQHWCGDPRALLAAAGPRLHALSLEMYLPYELIAHIIAAYPFLGRLQCHGFRFCRSSKARAFTPEGPDPDCTQALEALLIACGDIADLEINERCPIDETIVSMIGSRLGDALTSLTVNSFSGFWVDRLLLWCSSLARLTLCGIISDRCLQHLSMYCKHLENLSLRASHKLSFVDAGMIAVFMGCRKLREVRWVHAPLITFASLQVVLELKLPIALFWKSRKGIGFISQKEGE